MTLTTLPCELVTSIAEFADDPTMLAYVSKKFSKGVIDWPLNELCKKILGRLISENSHLWEDYFQEEQFQNASPTNRLKHLMTRFSDNDKKFIQHKGQTISLTNPTMTIWFNLFQKGHLRKMIDGGRIRMQFLIPGGAPLSFSILPTCAVDYGDMLEEVDRRRQENIPHLFPEGLPPTVYPH